MKTRTTTKFSARRLQQSWRIEKKWPGISGLRSSGTDFVALSEARTEALLVSVVIDGDNKWLDVEYNVHVQLRTGHNYFFAIGEYNITQLDRTYSYYLFAWKGKGTFIFSFIVKLLNAAELLAGGISNCRHCQCLIIHEHYRRSRQTTLRWPFSVAIWKAVLPTCVVRRINILNANVN